MKTKQEEELSFGNLIKASVAKFMPKLRDVKTVKLTIVGLICGLFLATASAPSAFADDYTYVFTAGPGQPTYFNGSTIEIAVTVEPYGAKESVVNWNLVDTALPANVTFSQQIIPGTSVLFDNYISGAQFANWSGDFAGDSSGFNFYSENAGTADSAMVGDYVEGMPQIPSQDASGSWTSTSAPEKDSSDKGVAGTAPHFFSGLASVPDAGSSFGLLAAATAALGAGRFFFRGRRN